jgi:hypothetical protein
MTELNWATATPVHTGTFAPGANTREIKFPRPGENSNASRIIASSSAMIW